MVENKVITDPIPDEELIQEPPAIELDSFAKDITGEFKEQDELGKPISVAYFQCNKTEKGYTVKSLNAETMIECSTRYDAMKTLRDEVLKTISVNNVHVDSVGWKARDLRDDFAKAMGGDGLSELHKKHEILHDLADDDVTSDQAYLHHFITAKAMELGEPIDCEGGSLSQPVIVDHQKDVDINEAIATEMISEEDGKEAIEEGVKRADIITLMDSDGHYVVIVPTETEEEDEPMDEIAKALGLDKGGLVIPFLDFLKADKKEVPKILTDIVDEGNPDQFTLAPYYVPNTLDGHGEFVETRDLEKAVNEWSLLSPNRNVFLQHDEDIVAGTWVQLIVMPWEFESELRKADGSTYSYKFPKGTVLIGVVWKNWAWKLILEGKITGMSMGGMAVEKAEQEVPE